MIDILIAIVAAGGIAALYWNLLKKEEARKFQDDFHSSYSDAKD